MSKPVELTLEQKFNLRSFETQVEKMSREQAQEMLIKMYELMINREALYKAHIKGWKDIDVHLL